MNETEHTDPLEAVEQARDGEDTILRVTHPWGQHCDYAPQHDVLEAPKWTALIEGAEESRILPEHKVLAAAYDCEPDVEVIDRSESEYGSEGGE